MQLILKGGYNMPITPLPPTPAAVARRSSTIIIAASNSANPTHADLRCAGNNDQTQIQQAIFDLGTRGGNIHLMEGLYNITNTISLSNPNINFSGSGRGSILRRMFDGFMNLMPILLIEGMERNHNIKISDLTFDGNNFLGTSNHGIQMQGGAGEPARNNLTINNCNFINNVNGIYLNSLQSLDGAWYNTIKNCSFLNNSQAGIFLDMAHNIICVENGINGGDHGIVAVSCDRIIINNNVIFNSMTGILLQFCGLSIITYNQLNNRPLNNNFPNPGNIITGNI